MNEWNSIKKRVAMLLAGIMLLINVPAYGLDEELANIKAQSQRVPITWARSSEEKGYKLPNQKERTWSWEIANAIKTPITEIDRIWDASTDPYYKGYVKKTDYSAATWQLKGSAYPRADLRRFRGTFEVPEGYSTEDFVTLKSVRQEAYKGIKEGNIIPINDNIYIFIYPEGIKDLITDDVNSKYYFGKYLAFWTGTANRASYGIQTFLGKGGTRSYHEPGKENGLLNLADGWYAEANIDNIGKTMHDVTGGAPAGTSFVIDIFTEENSGGGGMDEMVLEFKTNPGSQVVAKDEIYMIKSNQETTIEKEKGLLVNDMPNGNVKAKLVRATQKTEYDIEYNEDGTYNILKAGNVVASLKYFDDEGQFKILPVADYVGEIQFTYEVTDKLGKVAEATAIIYVLPQIKINHLDEDTGEVIYEEYQGIYGNPYSTEELGKSSTVYWMNGTDKVPDNYNITEHQAVKAKDASYKFKSGEVISKGTVVAEKEISNIPYNYTFEKENQEINLYYGKKYPYTISYYIDKTETFVPGINPAHISDKAYAEHEITIAQPTSDKGYRVKANQPTSLLVSSDAAKNHSVVYYISDETQHDNPYVMTVKHIYKDKYGDIVEEIEETKEVFFDQEVEEGPRNKEGYTYTTLLVNGRQEESPTTYKGIIKEDLTLELIYEEVVSNLKVEHKYLDDANKDYKVPIAVSGTEQVRAGSYVDTTAGGTYEANVKYEVVDVILTKTKPGGIGTGEQTTSSAIRTTGSVFQTTGSSIQIPIALDTPIDIEYGGNYTITLVYDIRRYKVIEKHIYEGLLEEGYEEHPHKKYGEILDLSAKLKGGYVLKAITINGETKETAHQVSLTIDEDKAVVFYYEKEYIPGPGPNPNPEPEPDPTPEPTPEPDPEPTPDIDVEVEDEIIPGGEITSTSDATEDMEIEDEIVPGGGITSSLDDSGAMEVEDEMIPGGVANPKTGQDQAKDQMALLLVSGLAVILISIKKKLVNK